MLKKFLTFVVVAASAALMSCGDDNSLLSPGGGGGGTVVVTMGSGIPPAFSAGTIAIAVPSLSAGGATSLSVSLVTADDNLYLQDTTVTFSSACIAQSLATAPTVSTSTGVATTTYSATGCSGDDVITASATAEGQTVSATGTVMVQAVTMGSGIPPAFSAGTIAIAVPSLAAGGGTSLSVSLVNANGTFYLQDTTVTFSSACIAQSLATAPTVSTSTGVATTTYSATGCSGDDVITASATAEGQGLSATGTVTVAAAVVGSIRFDSATPQKIGLKGTGGVGLDETATVVFKVVDSTGGPVAGAAVGFALDTSVGGITFTPDKAISGADGLVQTVVNSGTVATSVRVSAVVTALGIGTQSSQLVITTGLPDNDSMSLSVSCPNVEGLELDGTEVDVTIRLADRYNNPVPDGTAVTFNTEGGSILGSCSTTTTGTQSGLCSVTWTSSNPRPDNGRSSIIATAIGEESFVDVNGNGIFDNVDTWTDLPEAFRDDNGSGDYDLGEFYLDFNGDRVRSPGDGQFNGLLCEGPGSPAGGCSPNQKLTVSASNLIIMSGSSAKIADSTGGNNFGSGIAPVLAGGGSITFTIGDTNDQPLPAGTKITIQASDGLTLGNPKAYTVPCTNIDGPISYGFSVSPPAADAPPGQLTLTVEVPSGLQTVYFVAVTP